MHGLELCCFLRFPALTLVSMEAFSFAARYNPRARQPSFFFQCDLWDSGTRTLRHQRFVQTCALTQLFFLKLEKDRCDIIDVFEITL